MFYSLNLGHKDRKSHFVEQVGLDKTFYIGLSKLVKINCKMYML
jgi:hypothetical protein